jgi:hypothetical protein
LKIPLVLFLYFLKYRLEPSAYTISIDEATGLSGESIPFIIRGKCFLFLNFYEPSFE